MNSQLSIKFRHFGRAIMTIKDQALLISLLLTAQLSGYPQAAYSQEVKQVETPEAVAERSFKALKEGNTDDYIALMAPSEIERFKDGLMIIVNMAKEKGQGAQFTKLFGVEKVDDIEKLDSKAFFKVFIGKQMSPQATKMYAKSSFDMIGHVMEGEDLAHCVYQLEITGLVKKHNIVSMKKTKAGWKMLLTSNMDKMLSALKAKFKQSPGKAPDLDPGIVEVNVLGQIVKDDSAYVVYRSTSSIIGTKIKKVSPLLVKKDTPVWKLVMDKDKSGIEKLLVAKLEKYAKMANELYKAGVAAQNKTSEEKDAQASDKKSDSSIENKSKTEN